jgi:hypothetical protein
MSKKEPMWSASLATVLTTSPVVTFRVSAGPVRAVCRTTI